METVKTERSVAETAQEREVYRYLLRGVSLERPNQAFDE